MKRHRSYDLIAAGCRVVLGLVFLAAALLKWFDPAGQSTYYGNFAHTAPAFGWAIVAGELLLGVWLVTGFRSRLAAATALFSLSLFSGAIVADMLAKHPLPCGCFGAAWEAAHSPAAIEHALSIGLARDVVFILLAASVLIFAPEPRGSHLSESESPTGDSALGSSGA